MDLTAVIIAAITCFPYSLNPVGMDNCFIGHPHKLMDTLNQLGLLFIYQCGLAHLLLDDRYGRTTLQFHLFLSVFLYLAFLKLSVEETETNILTRALPCQDRFSLTLLIFFISTLQSSDSQACGVPSKVPDFKFWKQSFDFLITIGNHHCQLYDLDIPL